MTARGSDADEKYSVYSRSLWENRLYESERNRLIWLEAQEDELPGGSLGKKYREHIRFLKTVTMASDTGEEVAELGGGITVLEKKLLNLRFEWKGGPGGRFSYRELTAGLREDPGNKVYAGALIEEAFMLADSGMAELITLRNRLARASGYNDYWEMVNGRSDGGLPYSLKSWKNTLRFILRKRMKGRMLPVKGRVRRVRIKYLWKRQLSFFAPCFFLKAEYPVLIW